MYRPSLLKEAGYDAPPQTWDELLDMAKTLNKDTDGDGTIDIYGVGITASRSSITQRLSLTCFILPEKLVRRGWKRGL